MLRFFGFCGLLLAFITAYADSSVISNNTWIAEAPPATPVNAGYLQLDNTGLTNITLVAISSTRFPRIEIHKSLNVQGTSRMERLDKIELAAGTSVQFASGDLHLMLYNNGNSPVAGETIPLTLQFADGTSITVEAEVRKMSDNNSTHKESDDATTGSWTDYAVMYQYLLPQHWLSAMMYKITRIRWSPLKNLMINTFIRTYHVDMSIAVKHKPQDYRTFNEFFTRSLQDTARPVDPGIYSLISPVDGAISQFGRISNGRLIQAKNHDYTVEQLLGGDSALAGQFNNGEFITIYLSPKDYHRIHMPVTGTLQSMTYIPGNLFSVNPATTRTIDNLFARNERLVTLFNTDIGNVALVMVGAIFVGSMETVWAGQITPADAHEKSVQHYTQSDKPIRIDKGVEMGRFNMGSTVIMLFEENHLRWNKDTHAGQSVQLGKQIATLK